MIISSTSVQAQDRPIQIALFTPVQIVPEDIDIKGFRFDVIYGRNASVTGFDVGLVNHTTTGLSKGIQFSFIGLNESDFIGWQHGFVNITKGNFEGLQVGVVNYANQMKGVQFGLVNYAGSGKGLQIGLVNFIWAYLKNMGTWKEMPRKKDESPKGKSEIPMILLRGG